MKLKYLGDSKDAFKWDYHDFLMRELNFTVLEYIPMLTSENDKDEGKSNPGEFNFCDQEIVNFCELLRKKKDLNLIQELPVYIKSSYQIKLIKNLFEHGKRIEYFSTIDPISKNLLLFDPDNGFRGESIFNEKHIDYLELINIYNKCADDSVLSIFHHFRRKSFMEDFQKIKEQLNQGEIKYITAVSWSNKIMFVLLAKNENKYKRIQEVNGRYKMKNNGINIFT